MVKRALFLCTHNSARSQMAEGLLRHFSHGRFEACSAGTAVTAVRPLAIKAMREFGIDISTQESKTLDRFVQDTFDYVITLCDDARDSCPAFPNARERLHWPIPDPSTAAGGDTEQLAAYRRARDELMKRIEQELLASA